MARRVPPPLLALLLPRLPQGKGEAGLGAPEWAA
eukprot:gene55106-17441_t